MLMTHSESRAEFRQSNQSRQFVEQENDQPNYIQLGNILHELLSTIRTADDIPEALRKFESDGILYNEEITREKLSAILKKRFNNNQIKDWFSNRWNIFNECSILFIDPETNQVKSRRPDRVMTDGKQMVVVDFKFGKPKREYNDQVRLYMQLLANMGYSNIKGYLWYVYSNKVEEVK
jgi:CRISPR/Cas system-associated exonuclease Cas4 (RecB family)